MRGAFKLLYFVKRNTIRENGDAPIIARITIGQTVTQLNTRLEINPAHWSMELGKTSGRTTESVHISSMLEGIRSIVHQHYHMLMAQNGYVTAKLIKDVFLGKIAGKRTLIEFFKQHNEQYLRKVKMDTADRTYSRYELAKRRLMEFMKFKYSISDMLTKDVDMVFIKNFLLYIKNNYRCSHNTAMKFV